MPHSGVCSAVRYTNFVIYWDSGVSDCELEDVPSNDSEINSFLNYGKIPPLGGMTEWTKVPVLKTGWVQAHVGSNPTPSAT